MVTLHEINSRYFFPKFLVSYAQYIYIFPVLLHYFDILLHELFFFLRKRGRRKGGLADASAKGEVAREASVRIVALSAVAVTEAGQGPQRSGPKIL